MAKLVFHVQADYEEVIKLRNEIEKLKKELKGMDASQSPVAFNTLNMQLSASTKRMDELVTEAAKVGAAMDVNFKRKIFDASQTVNGFTSKIIEQKAVVKDVEADVKRLGEAYRNAKRNNPWGADAHLAEYNAARKVLDEEKAALFGLTQEQANARLSVKKLRDEYALYRDNSKETVVATEGIGISLKKAFAVIGGAALGKQLISDMIRVRGEFQAADTAIQTLLGSEEKANALMSQVREYAKISPLEFSDVTQATQMMLGFNIEAEKVPRFLQAIGDVSMGNTQKFNSLTLAFSQMSAAGKLMGQDLNQMINAGFNPLQTMSEKTGKSIAQLKDEMSKGAISAEMVQQAFIDATSAGGKFYNMSENASKTINGQLSMMQDAMDVAFNEMGQKSEGVIMKGIEMTTSLIENYETVGKVLSGLVVTYGTYRTAVMLATVATGKHTIAEIALTNARVLARKAQLALNAAMLTNPYVLLATAVVGLGVAMLAFRDSATEAEKAQRRFNEQQEEAKKQEEEHKQKIDSLVQSSRDIALSDLQRGRSLAELRKEYPKIFAQYDIETIKLADILKLKQQITEEDAKRAGEKQTKELSNIESEIKYYENLLKTLSGQQGVDGYVKKLKELRAMRDVMLQEKGKGISEQFISNLKDVNTNEFDRYISELEKRIRGKGENGTVKLRLPIDIKGTLSDEAIYNVKDIKTLIDTAKSVKQTRIDSEKNKTTYKQDYEKAKKDWDDAKKKLSEIEKDKSKFTSKQYEEAKKRKETAEKKYKDLGGITGGSLTNKKNQVNRDTENQIKKQEQLAEQLLQLRWKNQQDEINLMEDGTEKKRKQLDLDFQMELAEIRKLEKEWSSYNNGELTQEQSIEISRRYTNAENKYNKGISKLEGGFTPEELRKSMNEYLSVYGEYQDRRNAIIALGEERKRGKNEWEQKSIDKETNKQLSELDEQELKTTSAISQLFGDMKDKTLSDLREINEKGKKALEFLKGGKWDAERGAEFGITEENFNEWSQDPEKIAAVTNALKDNEKAVDNLRPAYSKVVDGVKKFFDAGSDPKKVTEALQDIKDGLNEIMQVANFLSSTFSSLGDAFGSDVLSGIADGINVAMDSLNSAMQGAQAGAMFGPIGAAAGAAIGLVSSLASSIAKIHDKKNEKNIKKLQEQIEAIDKSYENLGDSIEKAYSKDASELIEQQNTMLEQTKLLIQQQIEEEKDKKNADEDRIKEWEDKIEDIDKQIAENKESAMDAIFGEDLKSAIDNFADAYADAWASGEDKAKKAKDVVKKMMQKMVTESIKAAIQSSNSMEQIRQKLQEFYADNVLSGWEQDYIYQMAEDLQKELDSQFGWADELMGEDDSSSTKKSEKMGFATASQDSIDELNGRFTALQISGEEIKNQNIAQSESLNILSMKMSDVLDTNESTKNIADETRSLIAKSYLELIQISENTGNSAKYLKDIKADIAEVKKNTSNL